MDGGAAFALRRSYDALVQGQEAAGQVARAIRGCDAMPEDGPLPRPDLLIVARGGGSLEDLWAFNEEEVVRAIFESEIENNPFMKVFLESDENFLSSNEKNSLLE